MAMSLCTSPALAAGSAPATLQQLMSLLAQRKHGEVAFVEQDYLSVLDEPLKSSGVLIYDAPNHLEKRTLAPKPQSLVLDQGQLTVRRGRRTYHFDLSAYPQVAPYVDAIRATMAGDLGALERVFKVTFHGDLAQWRLGLVPLDAKVARGVAHIEITGAQADVHSVQIDKPNGDRSVMTLGSLATEGSAHP
jgi:hypothetical protein